MNDTEKQPPDGFEVKQDDEDSGVWLWKRGRAGVQLVQIVLPL